MEPLHHGGLNDESFSTRRVLCMCAAAMWVPFQYYVMQLHVYTLTAPFQFFLRSFALSLSVSSFLEAYESMYIVSFQMKLKVKIAGGWMRRYFPFFFHFYLVCAQKHGVHLDGGGCVYAVESVLRVKVHCLFNACLYVRQCESFCAVWVSAIAAILNGDEIHCIEMFVNETIIVIISFRLLDFVFFLFVASRCTVTVFVVK